MSEITLGIIGGGQLGSMLAIAAKKLNVKTVVFCDDRKATSALGYCKINVKHSKTLGEILISDDNFA